MLVGAVEEGVVELLTLNALVGQVVEAELEYAD